MKVLIANIGSTSFKYCLFDMQGERLLAKGKAERICQADGFPDYESAIRHCLWDRTSRDSLAGLDAVGFKAVHAGPLSGAHLVDDRVLAAMEEFSFHAPAHNPPYLAAIRAFQQIMPEVPLVVLFETAFFDSMDEASTTYAVPLPWRENLGIRRYGFHGASHRAAGERALQLIPKAGLRHVSCHLGGSSSVAAIRGGIAIDTSFGMSPQSGLPQNNRVGDLDAFALLFAMKRLGLSVDQTARILANDSGLAGISGASGDVRDLTAAAAQGDRRAQLALDVFVRAIRHYVGAFLLELGGIDILTFSGGVGENSSEVRSAVCEGMAEFGVILDADRNRTTPTDGRISAAQSRAAVYVVPADEERIVARAAAAVLFMIVQARM